MHRVPSAALANERSSVSCLSTWPHFYLQTNSCRECQPSLCSWFLIWLPTSLEPHGSLSPGSLWLLQTWPLCSLPLVTRELSPFGESLWQRGLAQRQVGMVSRSTGLYLTGYICCPNSLVPTRPLPPPVCPASLGPCCPCSPRSSCTIVVWATGYFLLGAKDYSVIRNVCLSGRLWNKDYK